MIKKKIFFVFSLLMATQDSFAERKAVYECTIRDVKTVDASSAKFTTTKEIKRYINSKFILDTANGNITGDATNNTYASGMYISNNGFVENFYAITSYFGNIENKDDFFVSLDNLFIGVEPNYFLSKYSHKFLGHISKTSAPLTVISGSCAVKDKTGYLN